MPSRLAAGALLMVSTLMLGAAQVHGATKDRGGARQASTKRYRDERLSFDYPSGYLAGKGAAVPGGGAVGLTPAAGEREDASVELSLWAGDVRVSDAELESAAARWHAARLRNRVSWGMRSEGGPPPEALRIGSHRWVRYRDRVRGVLRPTEQTVLCAALSGRLVCAVASATPRGRDAADSLLEAVLGSLTVSRP